MARKSKNDEYGYILSYITEGIEGLEPAVELGIRATNAYQGRASVNLYSGSVTGLATQFEESSPERAKELRNCAAGLPTIENRTVFNAVETVVSMTMGGPGQYEYSPYDPAYELDEEAFDRITSFVENSYSEYNIDSKLPILIRQAVLNGSSYFHLKPEADGTICPSVMELSKMILDPKRYVSSKPRFIGFKQMEPWSTVRSRITKVKKGLVLKSLNETDTYLSNISSLINDPKVDGLDEFWKAELLKDIDVFYRNDRNRYENYRNKESKDYDPDSNYVCNNIEMSYVYDLINNMYFEVVNRRYIVTARPTPLKKTVKKDVSVETEDGNKKKVDKSKVVYVDHPFVELPYLCLPFSRYPVSPLFYLLDDFDRLCAMESVLYHNLSIMSPLTFIGTSSDSALVSRVSSVAGEIVDGMPQTFGVLSKVHDLSPIMAAIQRYEDRIKRALGALDPFEVSSMLGDRATAKEVSAVGGQVSERQNQFIANIETAMAELTRKIIDMTLIYSSKKKFTFASKGKYAEVSPEELSSGYGIKVKLNSSLKLERSQKSRNALELMSYIISLPVVDQKEVFGTLLPMLLDGVITREQAEKMVKEPEPEPTKEETPLTPEEQMANTINGMDVSGSAMPEDLPPELANMMGGQQPQGPQLPPFAEEGGQLANQPV